MCCAIILGTDVTHGRNTPGRYRYDNPKRQTITIEKCRNACCNNNYSGY